MILLFAVAEISVRYLVPVDWLTREYRANSSNVWRLTWIERKQTGHRDPRMPFREYHPKLGWALKPNLRDLTVFETKKELNSNSQGLRGLTEYSIEKPKDKIRIAVIGDSFTFGEEVGDADTYSSILDKELDDVEVINFGVAGYGHGQILLYFEDFVSAYDPDIVILGFIRDDMRRNILSFRDYAKPKFELDGKLYLDPDSVPIPRPREVLENEKYRSRLVDILSILYQELLWKTGIKQRQMEELTAAILDRLLVRIKEINAIPVFVYLPHSFEIVHNDTILQYDEEKFFNRYCESRKIHCANLRDSFLGAIWLGTHIHRVGHWRENGHRVAATKIKEFLLKEGILKSAIQK